jgi:hypothetical protein
MPAQRTQKSALRTIVRRLFVKYLELHGGSLLLRGIGPRPVLGCPVFEQYCFDDAKNQESYKYDDFGEE